MPSSGLSSSSYSASPQQRLTAVVSHLRRERKLKVVVTRDLGPDVMPILKQWGDIELVTWPEDRACERQWLLDNIPGASGIIVMLTDKVDDELLEKAGRQLRIVSTMSVGYEHVDLRAISRAGVRLGFTPDVLTDAVADLSVMLALMASRNAGQTASIVQAGNWPNSPWAPFKFCGPQLSTSQFSPTRTVGFLGFGRIARATLARLIPFGITHCIYTTRSSSSSETDEDPTLKPYLSATNPLSSLKSITRVPLPTLAVESDVLFVLAPGGPETHHIVGEEFLKGMKKSAVLVNTARGTLVDSEALARALREEWIWGAGLDVVEGEPKIGVDHVLLKEPRCVILPHIASATFETRRGMATLAAKNLLAALDGGDMPSELDLKGRA
ncbi:uncharacterized protein STEHIDRAFT_161329 [Stereum hirsutum FP-91666 SS1]|uniref:uncharacterized protein n=1 Tax=Stereum hirsutum (strain FP-91666) TaxID=721885 RepID=UPI000444991C|nr:uncharacterized protein STEHIDRAFT_161329 [Stereum hirsutum FP-91666 SS1]EIM81974.1 hypothetical protein STEHIDRAFT_161329 [Stereum hirsutum FP-91666 SS1]